MNWLRNDSLAFTGKAALSKVVRSDFGAFILQQLNTAWRNFRRQSSSRPILPTANPAKRSSTGRHDSSELGSGTAVDAAEQRLDKPQANVERS